MKRKIVLASVLLCCLGLVEAWSGRVRASQATTSLVGSWQLTLVPDVPPTDPPTIPIPGLATFTSDETAIATAGGVIVGPAPSITPTNGVTPAQGIWQPGPVFGRFFIQLVGIVTNENGSLFARRNFTATVGPNASNNQFSGTYNLQIVDSAGTVIGTGSGTITGKLIPHPPLP